MRHDSKGWPGQSPTYVAVAQHSREGVVCLWARRRLVANHA